MDYTIKWEIVENNVNDKLINDSLLHTLSVDKKIKRQTKMFNDRLKKVRILHNYKHFLQLKRKVLNECSDSEAETDDEPGMDYESYKIFYKNDSRSKPEKLRKLLKFFVRTKGKNRFEEKRQGRKATKQPTVVCKKPAKVPGVKNSKQYRPKENGKVKAQANFIKNWLGLPNKPSTSSSEKQNLTQTDVKLQLLKTKSPDPRKTPSVSRDENKDRCNDKEEKYNRKELIEDSAAIISENGSLDNSESISDPKSPVVSDCEVEYCPEETSFTELQSTIVTGLENPVEFDEESQTLNSSKQDYCNVIVDAAENLGAFNLTSNSKEIFTESNLRSPDNLRISDAKIELEVNRYLPTETDKYALTSDHDSGNNSLSDTNSTAEQHKRRHSISTGSDNYNRETAMKLNNLDIIERRSMSPDELKFELENTAKKIDGMVESGNLDDDLNILQIKLGHENSLEKQRQTGSDNSAVNKENPGLMATQELDTQSESRSCVENKVNKGKGKPKIRKIERYKDGCELLNEHPLWKQKNVDQLNNSVHEVTDLPDKTIGDLPPPESDEHTLRCRKSSVNSSLSLGESNDLDQSLDNEISLPIADLNRENIGESDAEESSLKNDKQTKCREHNLPGTDSPTPSQSLIKNLSSFCTESSEEEFENCVKTQLLSKTEQLLEHSTPCEEKNLSKEFHVCSQDENSPLLNESNEKHDKPLDIQPIAESTQLTASNESTEESNPTKIRSHNLNKSLVITDSFRTSKPISNKRPISSSSVDYHMLTSTPTLEKQPRLLRQMSNEQLKVRSCDYKSPEAISCESQLTRNKDDSANRSDQNLSTPRNVEPKRRLRPRTLKEFANTEALCLDVTVPHFRLKNISEDDEIWLMDVPKTINPQDLKDQTILLGRKSAMTLGDDCYKVSSKRSKETSNISCIFARSKRKKEYEIVNIVPQGCIKFSQKHTVLPRTDNELISPKLEVVPFPKNLRRRHPLLGAVNKNET